MEKGGVTRRLVDFADALVGFLPGGLSATNVTASMFFGGVSGSAVADTSATGTILIPAMVAGLQLQVFSSHYRCFFAYWDYYTAEYPDDIMGLHCWSFSS